MRRTGISTTLRKCFHGGSISTFLEVARQSDLSRDYKEKNLRRSINVAFSHTCFIVLSTHLDPFQDECILSRFDFLSASFVAS